MRITYKFLETQASNLNTLVGAPQEAYCDTEAGGRVPNAGHYSISCAYGGYALHRMSESGGVADVFRSGHISARQLSQMIDAFHMGLQIGATR